MKNHLGFKKFLCWSLRNSIVFLSLALLLVTGTAKAQLADQAVLIIAPSSVLAGHNLSTACQVQVYEGDNLSGVSRVLLGPLNLSNLKLPEGTSLKGKTNSLVVGPQATVTAYTSENFKDKETTFGPGTKLQEVKKSPLGKDIESLRITCGTGSNSGTPTSTSGPGTYKAPQ